MDGQTGMNSPL